VLGLGSGGWHDEGVLAEGVHLDGVVVLLHTLTVCVGLTILARPCAFHYCI
jgi:hypothetical protein